MHAALLVETSHLARRRSEGSGCGALGCFIVILGIGAVLYLVLKGRRDRREVLGAAKRPMGSGPIQPVTFACPFPKCGNCGAAGDKMKQQWDGFRKVTWTCGYCGNAQVQELQDHELPPSARQRMGLDPQPGQGFHQGYPEGPGGSGFGGAGGLLTGMMLGSMLGGGGHHPGHQGNGTGSDGGSSSGGDWGDGGGSGGSDWGDSGGDSGGDWGGGDSGGDSGGDW